MFSGLYRTPFRHHQFDALPYEAPCAGPSLLALLKSLLRRLFHRASAGTGLPAK